MFMISWQSLHVLNCQKTECTTPSLCVVRTERWRGENYKGMRCFVDLIAPYSSSYEASYTIEVIAHRHLLLLVISTNLVRCLHTRRQE